MVDTPRASNNGDDNNGDGNGANSGGNGNLGGPPHNNADDPQNDLVLEDVDILTKSLDSPRHDALRRRLVSTTER